MAEIKYRDQFEEIEGTGKTISDLRRQFKDEFGIPDKAIAKVNGKKIKFDQETETVLKKDETVQFSRPTNKAAILVGALLAALALTGSIFAYGFINSTTTLTATLANSNFADVSVNTSASTITWNTFGFFKGTIPGPNGVFNVQPATNYNGDLVVTVTLGNADKLAKVYRMLALKFDMIDSTGNPIDINESGAADANDWVMLTLDNGAVSMYPRAVTSNMTVRLDSGFFIANVIPNLGWGSGTGSPDLFCEVAQR